MLMHVITSYYKHVIVITSYYMHVITSYYMHVESATRRGRLRCRRRRAGGPGGPGRGRQQQFRLPVSTPAVPNAPAGGRRLSVWLGAAAAAVTDSDGDALRDRHESGSLTVCCLPAARRRISVSGRMAGSLSARLELH